MNVLAVRDDARTQPIAQSVQQTSPRNTSGVFGPPPAPFLPVQFLPSPLPPMVASQSPPATIQSPLQTPFASPVQRGADALGKPFEPLAFVWNHQFYNKVASANDMDVTNEPAVTTRTLHSVMQQVLDDHEYDDFAVQQIQLRRVDPVRDADLVHVNPRAHWIADAIGVDGTGTSHTIPSVVNSDGAVFVDPRIRGL